MSTTDKGQRLVRLARAALEARGALVETAPNVVRWIPAKRSASHLPGRAESRNGLRPVSLRHDFFTCWDLLVVTKNASRFFVQVTVAGELAHRRAKILASGFPHTALDCIAAYYPGRNRHFRLYRGGEAAFDRWDGDTLVPPRDPKSGGRRLQTPPGAVIEREVAV